MPLPPPPSDSKTGPQEKHDPAAENRVRAHMIGANAATSGSTPVLSRIRRWFLSTLSRFRR
jgi:hypothetical protein